MHICTYFHYKIEWAYYMPRTYRLYRRIIGAIILICCRHNFTVWLYYITTVGLYPSVIGWVIKTTSSIFQVRTHFPALIKQHCTRFPDHQTSSYSHHPIQLFSLFSLFPLNIKCTPARNYTWIAKLTPDRILCAYYTTTVAALLDYTKIY